MGIAWSPRRPCRFYNRFASIRHSRLREAYDAYLAYLRTNDSFFCIYEAPCGAKTTYKLYRYPFLLFLPRFHHFSQSYPNSSPLIFQRQKLLISIPLAVSPPFPDLTSSLNIGRNHIRRNGGDLPSIFTIDRASLYYRAGESRVLNHVEKERKKKRFRFNCW